MLDAPYDESTEAPERPGLPWERRDRVGALNGLLTTCGRVIFSPSAAFRDMRQLGGWGDPLSFAVIVGTLGAWAGQVWQILGRTLLAAYTGTMAEEVAARNLFEIALAIAAPFVVLLVTVIAALVMHVLLVLFGGAPHPFETTFRVMSYSWAVNLFNVVPLCGFVLAVIWGVVVRIIGLREAQEVPVGRAAAAVLLPWLLACFCLLFLLLVVGGLAYLGMQGLA